MKLLFKTAVRTLVRNKRRSGITILSISLSLGVIFWIQSVMAARSDYIIDKVLSISGGDLQIFTKDYQESKRLADVLHEPLPDLGPAVGDAKRTVRIRMPGLIAAAEESFPVFLNGIDPVTEVGVSRIANFLVAGEFLTAELKNDCSDRPIYLGEKLARLLRVGVGERVVFLGQAADGTLGNELFRIKGIYNSRSGDFDKVQAFTTLSCARKVGAINGFHEIAYKLERPSRIDEVEREANRILSTSSLIAVGWKQANPMVAQMLRFNDGMIALLTTILVSLVIFGTVNTMLMSIHERAKEFGVMLALGMQPQQLMAVIVIEAFLMGLAGVFIGFCIGGAVIVYHRWAGFDLSIFVGKASVFQGVALETTMVHPIVALVPFLKAASSMVLFVTVAGLLPAYRASRLAPVETIRG